MLLGSLSTAAIAVGDNKTHKTALQIVLCPLYYLVPGDNLLLLYPELTPFVMSVRWFRL